MYPIDGPYLNFCGGMRPTEGKLYNLLIGNYLETNQTTIRSIYAADKIN